MFLEAIYTSFKIKDSNYMSKVIEGSIGKVGGILNIVAIVSYNATNYKRAAKIIFLKYPKKKWVPCETHSIIFLL